VKIAKQQSEWQNCIG